MPTCGACALPVARLIGRLVLPFRIVTAPDRRCLCRKSSCTELDYLFRIALEVAGRPRLLVIGGNPDSDKALRRIGKPEAHVVREHIRRVDPRLVGAVDVLLIARGIAKHKDTLPYTEAYDALSDDRRPLRLETQSPNANAQALTLIAERERIRAHLTRGQGARSEGGIRRRDGRGGGESIRQAAVSCNSCIVSVRRLGAIHNPGIVTGAKPGEDTRGMTTLLYHLVDSRASRNVQQSWGQRPGTW